MRKYEPRTVTRQEKVQVECRCDLCGKAAGRFRGWGEGSYDVAETELSVTVREKSGSEYPDGGSGTEHVIDLCPDCFKGRLIPWLRSQGAVIEEKEWEW